MAPTPRVTARSAGEGAEDAREEFESRVPGLGFANAIGMVAGDNHNLALKSAGPVVVWDRNNSNPTNVPANANHAIAISAGGDQSAASKTNDTATTNFSLDVTVPANATASIYILGATNLSNITESSGYATNTAGLLSLPQVTNGAGLFQVGAGSYQFKAPVRF